RLAALDGVGGAQRLGFAQLRVQALVGVYRLQPQRVTVGAGPTVRALGLFHPHWMALAVGVAIALDLAAEDLDEARWRAKRIEFGIITEVRMPHPALALREEHIALLPEFGKRRH